MTFRHVLTLIGGILLAGGGAAQSHAKKADNPDLKEIRAYRLKMDVIQRYMEAFKTVNNDETAKKCFENNPPANAPTLDAGEKLLNACPSGVAYLTSAGIKPREFLIVTTALIGDFMAVSMKKNKLIKEYPASVSPENAAFIEHHYNKLQVMLAPLTGSQK